jgi:uncharacterized protein (UPF0210 family)
MKIRSITYLFNPLSPIDQGRMSAAGEFRPQAQVAFENAGYEVQTTRLATVPFPNLLSDRGVEGAVALAKALESAAQENGYDYISLGPAIPDKPDTYAFIPEMLAATENLFLSGVMGTSRRGVSLSAVRACAEVMHCCSSIDPNGFTNLRFAALANVPPGSPFFPSAFHGGGPPQFAIATQSANLAVEAFTSAKNLNDGVRRLIRSIEYHGRALESAADEVSERSGVDFSGIDFSFAPFPEEAHSLGTALERIGVPAVGMHGSLAAAAILADALDKADFKRVGFSGLLLPPLEDSTLAYRAAQGTLTVRDLLLFSAVCGTGLDTVPLPGDTTPEQLTALLLDQASLAQRLEKPLTARLMPIPGKKAGELTTFDFPYFANSRVLALNAAPLEHLLAGEESFSLQARK